jgi:hypothetical protein
MVNCSWLLMLINYDVLTTKQTVEKVRILCVSCNGFWHRFSYTVIISNLCRHHIVSLSGWYFGNKTLTHLRETKLPPPVALDHPFIAAIVPPYESNPTHTLLGEWQPTTNNNSFYALAYHCLLQIDFLSSRLQCTSTGTVSTSSSSPFSLSVSCCCVCLPTQQHIPLSRDQDSNINLFVVLCWRLLIHLQI